jgi:hypothetical protein
MEREEMIKILMEKANVSHEEAEEVLGKCNWDVLDSIIYLERNRKAHNNETNTIIEVVEESKENEEKHKNKNCGIGEIIGRIFKFIKKAVSKGNENYFEITKNDTKPIRISLTISVILVLIAFWPVGIMLVIGLLFGYKYSITGPDINNKVNDILDKASESANNIKNDFKESYKESK